MVFNIAWITLIGYLAINLSNGHQISVKYIYDYSTSVDLNEVSKLKLNFEKQFEFEKIWQNSNQTAFRLKLKQDPRDLFICYHLENNEVLYKDYYIHHQDEDDKVSIKKAISYLIESFRPKQQDNINYVKSNRLLSKSYLSSNINKSSSLLQPVHFNQWSIEAKLDSSDHLITESKGWQKVSFKSRIDPKTHIHTSINYNIKLVKEEPDNNNQFEAKNSLSDVIQAFGAEYIKTDQQDKLTNNYLKTCVQTHNFKDLFNQNVDILMSNQIGTLGIFNPYLDLLDLLQNDCSKTLNQTITDLLNTHSNDQHLLSVLLDLISSSNQIDAIHAAFDFLDLTSNDDLDISERFLVTLSTSFITQSRSKISESAVVSILNKLLTLIDTPNWASLKLKYSTLITLATLLRAYNKINSNITVLNGELNQKVIRSIFDCLKQCEDSECRISLLHALYNAANICLTFDRLAKIALNEKQKRESVAALRAIDYSLVYFWNNCDDNLHDRKDNTCSLDSEKLIILRSLIRNIIFGSKYETTAKLVAIKIANNIQDKLLLESIFQNIDKFENFELTTLFWNTVLASKKISPNQINWLTHSNFFNGSSAVLKNDLRLNDELNLAYTLSIELFGPEKLLKESSFQFHLNDGQKLSNHLFSVDLFARGLDSMTGEGSNEEESEATSAGMVLSLFDFKLRPYTFFTGKGELLGHVWSNIAGEPLTAFSANLLITNINEKIQLINGFSLDQSLIGILSLELTGEAQISLWNRNSQTLVKGIGSVVFKGTNKFYQVNEKQSFLQHFELKGETSFDIKTDIEFYSMPIRSCIRMSQSEMITKFSNKTIETNSKKPLIRTYHTSYRLPGKSFPFHDKNNKMCSIMLNED